MSHIDNLKKLHAIIDQQHLLYLEFDEIPEKIDQRCKLETFIKEYLCCAPHNMKFFFQETSDVLHRSASNKDNFSAYKAAVAWKAIGKYANNLISHPWRKEFRNIKLYCGFYKHEIEENLAGAELMFKAMGYKQIGHSTLSLYGILDPDKITNVSKDAMLAYVECQIIKQVWETLSSQYQITWLEILEFRENHVGTPEQVINSLAHKYCQRHYEQQIYDRQIQLNNSEFPQSEYFYKYQPFAFDNQQVNQYSSQVYSFPLQGRCMATAAPQQVISPSSLYPYAMHSYTCAQANKPQDIFYADNKPHRIVTEFSPINTQNYTSNGYFMDPAMHSIPSNNSTGLVELDFHSTLNNSDQQLLRPDVQYNHLSSPHQILYKSEESNYSRKPMDDGIGSYKAWNYVYKNLERQGYRKNLDTTDLLKGNQSPSQPDSTEVDSIIQSEVSEKIRKISLDKMRLDNDSSNKNHSNDEYNNEVKSKNLMKELKIDDKIKKTDKIKIESKPVKTNSEKKKKESAESKSEKNSGAIYSMISENPQKEKESLTLLGENIKSRKPKEADKKPLVVNVDDSEEKWQCATCTYLNSVTNNICEMCCKSKHKGNEITPQPTGGQQCSKCTLVNKPGLSICDACNASLQDSPTYI